MPSVLVVLSDADPVARGVAERWAGYPTTGVRLGGADVRAIDAQRWFVRRDGWHIHDETLAHDLSGVRELRESTVIFPSVHRSESNAPCFTVHPIGNLGGAADVGGRPFTVVPTDARRMTDMLRRLSVAGSAIGLPATFEATHHGPWLDRPAFFVEIGYGDSPLPAAGVDVLARALREVTPDPSDRPVVGIGGGHYVPHFTDLALKRRWAFGHLVSRHALERTTREVLIGALTATPGSEGVLFARAADTADARCTGVGPRLRDAEAPRREGGGRTTPSASSPPSGT